MRLLTAIAAFFRILFDRRFAQQVRDLLDGRTASNEPGTAVGPTPNAPIAAAAPRTLPIRGEAISLLAALQREARFVDFVRESLDGYADAQIGAAARDVHRACGKVLDRMFAMSPLLNDEEGATVEVPAGYDTGCYRLTGNVSGEPPFRGTMVHHGWKATRSEVPQWSGNEIAALVVAPVEVEIK
ncbi:MAG: DUF2760 domain-containing protein [Pirellulaceae bacterium]|nr:DUF2760 domain-containing protein [Pirellulaceae bacterium]